MYRDKGLEYSYELYWFRKVAVVGCPLRFMTSLANIFYILYYTVRMVAILNLSCIVVTKLEGVNICKQRHSNI